MISFFCGYIFVDCHVMLFLSLAVFPGETEVVSERRRERERDVEYGVASYMLLILSFM